MAFFLTFVAISWAFGLVAGLWFFALVFLFLLLVAGGR